ncbi:hypothetical protein E9993_01685 [Labilibacter sediminis]|nr:hypothetical protein E9993_01685 [Labilibacter sediminis]
MPTNNNKARGSSYEREVIKELQPYYKEKLYTTRNISTYLDSQGVDITTENPNDIYINYQIKTTANNPNYLKVLEHMPKDDKLNVFINKRTKKSDGGRFLKVGELAVMSFEDYKKLIEVYNKTTGE